MLDHIGVSGKFTAQHTDPHMNEGTHEHTWQVTVWFPRRPFRDLRSQKCALDTVLQAFDGKTLSPELWAAEDIALAVMNSLLVDCAGVDIDRPVEGFHAKVRKSALPSVYLCGPINGCTDVECKDWREFVKGLWPGRCIDPMRRDYRGVEADFSRTIVEMDKVDVSNCDIVLVNYVKPSVGTAMEVIYAWERGKIIVVVAPTDAVISPWLSYHSHAVVHTFAEGLAAARQLSA